MNDSTIIKTISRIHFIIVNFILFIFLTLSISFLVLQNGLLIDKVSFVNINIKQLYIKWDKKININIENIKISKSDTKSKITFKDIQNYISKTTFIETLFESIKIKSIIYDNLNFSLSYTEKSNNLKIISKEISLNTYFKYEDNKLNLKINNFYDKQRDIHINGNIIVNNLDSDITVNINVKIHNDASLKLLAYSTKEKLFYKLYSLKEIKDIKYIINLLNLPDAIIYWARDAITTSRVSIYDAYGWLKYNNLKNAYKNIYVNASANNLDYKYHKNLDAIHTKKTDLEFKNGIFFIRPREAYSYKKYLGNSWLKIDFTKKEELLTLYLLFDTKLDKNILKILNTYKINLPFLQRKGQIKTNLKLKVNLRTIDITSKGIFTTKKANFDYLGLNLDIFNTKILLKNYDVKVNNMQAKYKDIAFSNVKFKYNAKEKKGDINFNVLKINLDNLSLKLQKPVNVIYKIRPNNDKIHIDKSNWSIDGHNFYIDKTILGFNLDTLKIDLKNISIKNKIFNTKLDGIVNLKEQKANLFLNLKDKLKGEANLVFDKTIKISTKDKISYKYNNLNIALSNIEFNPKTTTLYVNNLSIKDENSNSLFKNKSEISFYVKTNQKTVYINNISIDLPMILNNIKSEKVDNKNTKKVSLKSLHININNSDIFISKKKKIITNKIKLNFVNNNISSEIIYHNAHAIFTYQDDKFNLYGSNFDDTFIEKLFDNSDFKGGNFSFSIRGKKDEYAGELYLQDATILKYKILNNTLAFINTIPSLATFSLPSFNKDGIYVKTSYIKFKQKNNIFSIYDAFLKSKELSIVGNGNINILTNNIDMNLTLKSDIGSNLSKIPLVGYIILNKDSLSTRVKLSGNLDDPKVETLLTTDILIAPLNIIKRALTLPLKLNKL